MRAACSKYRRMSVRAPSTPPGQANSPNPKLNGLSVLVVDDQEEARELTATVFERAGATVTLADSVQAALRALAEAEFAVLVSDIGMPVEDGYDLIRQLRSREDLRNAPPLPAVAVTAFGAPEDRRKALAAGFQDHFVKPVDWTALLGALERLQRPSP